MKSGEPFVLVLVTAPPGEPAERLARELVGRELAACVSRIGPIRSTYRWRGEVETAEEELLLVKTDRRLLDEVELRIREIHPYEVPEILAVPIESGFGAYLDWLRGSVRKAE